MCTEPALVPTKYSEEKGDQVRTLGLWGREELVVRYDHNESTIIIVCQHSNAVTHMSGRAILLIALGSSWSLTAHRKQVGFFLRVVTRKPCTPRNNINYLFYQYMCRSLFDYSTYRHVHVYTKKLQLIEGQQLDFVHVAMYSIHSSRYIVHSRNCERMQLLEYSRQHNITMCHRSPCCCN